MKRIKQILATVISCAIGVTGVMSALMAEAMESVHENQQIQKKIYGDLEYFILEDGTIKITGCDESVTSVDIPAEIDGFPVTSIGENAFSECINLANVTISDTVSDIGRHAFYNTPWINAFTGNMIIIGDNILYKCNGSGKLIVPDNVKGLSDNIFDDINNYTEITLSDNITSINLNKFQCKQPITVNIGKNTNEVKNWYGRMGNFDNILAVNVPDDNPYYSSEDGILFNKDKTVLLYYPISKKDITSYSIPESVTEIGNGAFFFSHLEHIQLPDSITRIGEYAFSNSYAVFDDLQIPNGTVEILEDAFSGCKISSLSIPISVKKIGLAAFYCSELTSATIKNPDCEITDDSYTFHENTTIHGYDSSTAQTYAEKYSRTFIPINSSTTTTATTTTQITTTTLRTTTTTLKTTTTATITTTTKEVTPDSITWGVDNWNFNNSCNYFTHSNTYISSSYLDKLRSNLTNSQWYTVQKWKNNKWGGSCYGMSSLVVLANAGLLPYSNWTSSADCLYKMDNPSQNSNVESLVNYYQLLQVKDVIQQQYRTVPLRSHSTNINAIISNLSDGSPVLVGYKDSDWGGHAVVAYDVNYGSWTWDGVTYQGQIQILDPNCSMSYNSRYCIYFNTSTYNWNIPAYSAIASSKGSVFNYVGDNISEINQGGYLSGTGNYTEIENYIACLQANEVDSDHSVQKVQRNGDTISHMNSAAGDIIADKFYFLGGESEGVNGYLLMDADAGYSVCQDNPSPMDLSIEYESCLFNASSEAGSDITFDKSGYVSVSGEFADYTIRMIYDEGYYETDWYGIELSGSNADKVILEQTDGGYFLSGENLQNIVVSVFNDDIKAEAAFTTEYTKVYLYEIDEYTIGAAVDQDGNGTYETKLEVKPEPEILSGDVDGDGEIDISDATAALTIYARNIAGLSIDEYTDSQKKAADIDGDGEITILDATQILTIYARSLASL